MHMSSSNPTAARPQGFLAKLELYWRYARPFTLLPPLLGMISGAVSALGAVAVHERKSLSEILSERGTTYLGFVFIGALMAAALNAASNVLNQWTDLENDRINKPKRPLPAGEVTVAETIVYFVVLYALSLLAAYFVTPLSVYGAPELSFWEQHQCFAIVLVGAFFTYIYSAPPARTKRWAWPAQITIAIPRGCLLKVAGWTCVAGAFSDVEPWFIGGVFLLFLLGASATKDFADMKGDAAAGCLTLPVKYGPRSAAYQISPFFVVPWLLIPVGTFVTRGDVDGDGLGDPILSGNPYLLVGLATLLFLYGLYTLRLILKDPESLATVENHPSWTHMYRMMMVAQIGFAVAYLV